MTQTSRFARTLIEPLESRIAPAAVIPDIVAGSGKTGATIPLAEFYDDSFESPGRTLVRFSTNLDIDPNLPGMQQGQDIIIELFDDVAPLTVQNFLTYVVNKKARGDYDGTFLHRSADFGAGSGTGQDIIQGGGFEVSDPRTHIPTGLEVHNEYDPAFPNVRGTIAMAKTGLSPNTATSEWFFNVNDNSSILDERNNGGFTVFGRVIQGMESIDRIAAVGTSDFGGALGDLPLQNYSSDPDSNPSTPPPEVKKENFITIEEAQVLPRPSASGAGLSFQVTVTGENGQPTNLITAQLVGTDLQLKYTREQSGTATVTVQPTLNGVLLEPQSFEIIVLPNLVANVSEDPFEGIIVGGDDGTVKVRIGNNGAALAETTINVKIYLSKTGGDDPNGTLFDANDLLVGQMLGRQISLQGGKTVTLPAEISVPETLVSEAGETYRLIAQIEPVPGASITQLFTDDDSAIDGSVHKWENRFGTFQDSSFGGRKNVSLTYAEPDGDIITFSFKGPGGGRLIADDGIPSLAVDATNAQSILKATMAKGSAGQLDLNHVQISETIRSVSLGAASVSGSIALSGGARSIVFGDVGGEGETTLLIGTSGASNDQRAKISLGHVQNLSLESLMPIRSLTALEWRDPGGASDSILTTSLGTLRVSAGDFEADVTITGDGTLALFEVEGFVRDATIKTRGDVGAVRVGGVDRANFFVGADFRPDALSDFTANRSIQSFAVSGVPGEALLWVDSQIVAQRFGSISVQGVAVTSDGEPSGFVADAIKRYNRIGGPTLTKLDTPGEFDSIGNYRVTVL